MHLYASDTETHSSHKKHLLEFLKGQWGCLIFSHLKPGHIFACEMICALSGHRDTPHETRTFSHPINNLVFFSCKTLSESNNHFFDSLIINSKHGVVHFSSNSTQNAAPALWPLTLPSPHHCRCAILSISHHCTELHRRRDADWLEGPGQSRRRPCARLLPGPEAQIPEHLAGGQRQAH